MIFWINICIFFLIILLLSDIKYLDRNNNILFAFSVLFIALLIGLRYEIGWDYDSYIWWFYSSDDGTLGEIKQEVMEPTFIFLTELFKTNGFSSQMMFLFYAVATYFFIMLGVRQYFSVGKERVFAIFIITFSGGIFWLLCSMIRQGLAIAILFWAYQYVLEKKFFKYVLACLFAMLFHYAALFGLVIYFIPERVYKKKIYLIILVFVLLITYLDIIPLLLNLALMLSGNEKYTIYLIGQNQSMYSISSLVLLCWYGMIFILFCRLSEIRNNKTINVYFTFIILHLLFGFSIVVDRLAMYLFLPYVIVLIQILKDKLLYKYLIITSIFCTFLFSVYIVSINQAARYEFGISPGNINYEMNLKLEE